MKIIIYIVTGILVFDVLFLILRIRATSKK